MSQVKRYEASTVPGVHLIVGKPTSTVVIHDPLPPVIAKPYIWPRVWNGRRRRHSQRGVARRSIWVVVVQKELNDCHVAWDIGQRAMLRMELKNLC